jgi:hypothetical protein
MCFCNPNFAPWPYKGTIPDHYVHAAVNGNCREYANVSQISLTMPWWI